MIVIFVDDIVILDKLFFTSCQNNQLMKPSYESVNASADSTLVVRKFNAKRFSAPYHFHPELELTLILKGKGKRYVGAHVDDYFPGDLVLLGSNLPHCWKTEDEAKGNSVSIVTHFNKNLLGEGFFERPGMGAVLELLNNSSHGLHFTGHSVEIEKSIISLFAEKNPFKKIILFLDILHALSGEKKFIILDKQNYYSALSENEKQRIKNVLGYVVENFQNSISLKEAAAVAHLTPHAFCKYFKKITRKTFMEAVNDYRIGFATKQLINTDKGIAEIGFGSGFNDLSNFHRIFKRKIKQSPLNYRNKFMNKLAE